MKKYWIGFSAVVFISFVVLGWVGVSIYQQAPPLPARVVTTDGQVVIEEGQISRGQNVWQALGGMEVGSVWGHGSYVAPDWSADWLHREAVFILDAWAVRDLGMTYVALSPDHQAVLRSRLQLLMRTNTYDPATGVLTLDPVRAAAFEANVGHYSDIFSNGRAEYAIPKDAQPDPEKLRALGAFFFWTSWAAAANRPGEEISYTSNWPHEGLVGNVPTADAVVWTGVSIILLLAGIGGMAWYYAAQDRGHDLGDVPPHDPLLDSTPTPSQQAVVKYFWTVTGLFLLQIIFGVVTAHYAVEGDALLRHPGILVPAVQYRTDMAHATRHLLDRHSLACGGVVYRSCSQRHRTPRPAPRREYALRSTPCRGPGIDGRRMAECSEQAPATASGSCSATADTSTSTSAVSGRSPCSSVSSSGCSCSYGRSCLLSERKMNRNLSSRSF